MISPLLAAILKKMPNCKLCLVKEADKKNSHIIPKFMGKRIFENSKPRFGLRIDIEGKSKKIQDTPKEDYILCKTCEERFAKIEHYFSLKTTSIHNYQNEKSKFRIIKKGRNTILECLKIPNSAFKLFIYSLVWKISISQSFEFLKFNLPQKDEEKLRCFLDENLKDEHKDMIHSMLNLEDKTGYESYVFKCISRNEFTRGIYTAYEFNENSFGIFLVDLLVFFYLEKENIPIDFNVIKEAQNEFTLITLADIERWKEINSGPLQNIGKNSS